MFRQKKRQTRSAALCLHNMLLFQRFFKKFTKRKDEKSYCEISYPVDHVKPKSCGYPRHSLLKGEAVHKCLCGSVERPEQNAVKKAHDRICDRLCPPWHIPWQEHSNAPEHRPYVKIRHPPHIKAGVKPVAKDVHVNRDQRLFAKDHRVGHCERSEQVNVRQCLHYDL